MHLLYSVDLGVLKIIYSVLPLQRLLLLGGQAMLRQMVVWWRQDGEVHVLLIAPSPGLDLGPHGLLAGVGGEVEMLQMTLLKKGEEEADDDRATDGEETADNSIECILHYGWTGRRSWSLWWWRKEAFCPSVVRWWWRSSMMRVAPHLGEALLVQRGMILMLKK